MIFFAYIDSTPSRWRRKKPGTRRKTCRLASSLARALHHPILVSGVMVGLVPYRDMLGSPAPMVVAIRAAEAASGGSTLLGMMTMLVELGAIAGSELGDGGADDGAAASSTDVARRPVPPFARKIHPKFRTPHITSIITGIIVALAAGFTPIGALGELVSIGNAPRIRHRFHWRDLFLRYRRRISIARSRHRWCRSFLFSRPSSASRSCWDCPSTPGCDW